MNEYGVLKRIYMAKVKNKEMLQSYILTSARYDFNVYEKRILYCLVELAQCEVEGLEFPKDCKKINHDLFGFINISIPCNRILRNEEDKNHSYVKKALLSLTKKVIEYEDNENWMALNIIAFPKIKKYENTFSFTIHPMIWDCILNFSKGYRKIEMKIVKDFISVYSMRFYELISGQHRPLTYSIDDLKMMFKLENKYKDTSLFIKRTIDSAKKELDQKSPYSFEYKLNRHGKGGKINSVTFYPTQNPEFKDQFLEQKELQKRISLRWDLSQKTIDSLKTIFSFDSNEINQHKDLFEEAEKKLNLFVILNRIKGYAFNAQNPKGYLISVLQKELKQLKEKEKFSLKEETYTESQEEFSMSQKTAQEIIKKLAEIKKIF